ncbi:hypothetical protein BKA62DRAFT_699007 [Auriculariales sp. MPI-PUGE-AT-0066]|nr:hypothetical protein BKA62DRAFT_699007 [Auriculariales sp. MPI-PUGE-AT-0066]
MMQQSRQLPPQRMRDPPASSHTARDGSYSSTRPSDWTPSQPFHRRPKPPIAVGFHTRDDTAPPCAFWLGGYCKQGGECSFRHDSPFAVRLPPLAEKYNAICRKFQRGLCRSGERCRYRHPPADVLEAAPVDEFVTLPENLSHSRPERVHRSPAASHLVDTLDRVVRNCIFIQFGPGLSVVSVSLVSDGVEITLSELPQRIRRKDLDDLLRKNGMPVYARIQAARAKQLPTASVIYANQPQALRAIKALDGVWMDGTPIRASLARVPLPEDNAPPLVQTTAVKLSCPLPSVSAILRMRYHDQARKRATQLHGRRFEGRPISAYYQDNGYPAVVIPELPVNVDRNALRELVCAESVQLTPPSYTLNEAQPALLALLNEIGPVVGFSIHPWKEGDTRLRAIAHFTRSDHVEMTIGKFDCTRQSCVANLLINLHRTFMLRYKVSKAQWDVIGETAKQIRAQEQSRCILSVHEPGSGGTPHPAWLVIQGDDPAQLSALRSKVQTLVLGQTLRDDQENIAWDHSFFASHGTRRSTGEIFIDSLNTEGKVFIICDQRLRHIRICGSTKAVADARRRLLWALKKHKKDRRLIKVPRTSFGFFVRGGLRSLREAHGKDNIWMNLVDGILYFRCSDDKVEAVRHHAQQIIDGHIQFSEARGASSSADSGAPQCPVCHCDVVEAIELACSHSYCKACLQLYMSSVLNSETNAFPIKCIASSVNTSSSTDQSASSCGSGIPPQVLQGLLSPDEEDALLEAAFLAHVHGNPAVFRFCPSPDCDQVYRVTAHSASSRYASHKNPTLFTCPSCLETTCTACHTSHPGQTCKKYRTAARAQMASESPLSVKRCPGGCGALLQKADGCNHVQCPVCKTHMCWLCLATFPHGGVYEHIAAVHGQGVMPGELPDDMIFAHVVP